MASLVRPLVTVALLSLAFVPAALAQHTAMPAGMTHEEHMAQMKRDAELKQQGNIAMGFDQDKTTHHFTITPEGGSIAVDVNDPADNASRDQIRTHLEAIAAAFGKGDFGKPLETHGDVPPGVPAMQRLRTQISYTYQETPRGGIVRIVTASPEARAAVHEFLTYQITEHETGDAIPSQEPPASTPHQGAQAATPADHFERHFDNADEWAKFPAVSRSSWCTG